jgi:glycosyltransferase involved in cell wall biosynthesis
MPGRVVMFTPTPSHKGGAAKHTRTIARGLADRGWDVTVIARRADGHRLRRSRIGDARVIEIPGFDRRLAGAVAFLVLALPLGLMRGRGTSYVSLELASQGVVASACAALSGRRYVGFSFSSGDRGELENFRASRLWPLRRLLLRRATYLVGQTPASAEELRAVVEEDRIAVVPTPVEEVDAPPLRGEPRALFTGRLTAGKGLDDLLDAWEQVLDRFPEARLTIAGSAEGWAWGWPPVEEELKRRVSASPELRRSVELTGWVADVAGLLATHDVYVYPSLSEGMSNALLEACSWLRVVVASDLPANRAVLGDGYPLLFGVGDADALAERLLTALGDKSTRTAACEQLRALIPAFHASAVLDDVERLLQDGRRR